MYVCLHEIMYTIYIQAPLEAEGTRCPKTRVNKVVLRYLMWVLELTLSPLLQQYPLLTAEQSL